MKKWLWLVGLVGLFHDAPSAAMSMDSFLTQAFRWTSPDDRPVLMVSRGMPIVWLQDPAAALPPNFQSFYSTGAAPSFIVPPGTALIAFPPQPRRSRLAEPARGDSDTHWLAVTQDGIWGVIDRRSSSRQPYLDEPDLIKIEQDERSPAAPTYAVIVSPRETINLGGPVNNPLTLGLTRGEIIRIVKIESDGLTIDFDGPMPDLARKREQLEADAALRDMHAPKQVKLKPGAVDLRHFEVSGSLVPKGSAAVWRAGNARYRDDIFGGSFNSIRMIGNAQLKNECNEDVILSSKAAAGASVEVKASMDLPTKIAQVVSAIGASFGFSAEAKASVEQSIRRTLSRTTTIETKLHPVEYTSGGQGTRVIWVGLARLCHGDVKWHTIVVRQDDNDIFLHGEFLELEKDGKPPKEYKFPTEPRLQAISPGGSPFNTIRGFIQFRCFGQAMRFIEVVSESMAGAPSFSQQQAMIVASTLQPRDHVGRLNVSQFLDDAACSSGTPQPSYRPYPAPPPAAPPPAGTPVPAAALLPGSASGSVGMAAISQSSGTQIVPTAVETVPKPSASGAPAKTVLSGSIKKAPSANVQNLLNRQPAPAGMKSIPFRF